MVLVFHQLAIAYALWFFVAQTLELVFFVFGIGSFEVEYFAIAFECKNMGTDTVEEPTVVADDYGTSGKKFHIQKN